MEMELKFIFNKNNENLSNYAENNDVNSLVNQIIGKN